MAHAITVYDGPLIEWSDSTYALDTFPQAIVHADDNERLIEVLNRGLADINEGAGSDKAWGRPLAPGQPVWLDFGLPSDDPSVPRKWAPQTYFFGVDITDRLIVQDWYSLDMTIGDLRRAGESGYLPGDWDQVVALLPEGLGGGPDVLSTFVEFLRDVGVDVAVGATVLGASRAKARAKRSFDDRRARKVIASWHDQGIEGPWVLSNWLEVKHAWDAGEVARRLGIDLPEAESLLKAMGFEYSELAGAWTIGTTKKALKRRRRWDEGVSKEWQRPRDGREN